MWLGVRLKGLYHPAGTCRMGPTGDPASVVDAELRVHGIPNLRVADCSIMPRVVAAHPSATAVMIGEKLAAMVEATRRASAA
jgi:choline dehydrogenase-like flavoprotein